MKKQLSALVLLLAVLLSGCGAALSARPEPAPAPPAEATEDIAYQVVTDSLLQTVTAEDGTELMNVSFQLPRLQALSDGQPISQPATPAQTAAMERVQDFNALFDQWADAQTAQDYADEVRARYAEMPELFTGEPHMRYSEEFTYTAYQLGSLVSISAVYFSYLGGAHPNTVYFSWNFDLTSGTFLTLPELAGDPQAFTLAVADMIEAQARERIAADPDYQGLAFTDVYWSDYREIMEKWASDYAAFFDAEGLTVIFSAIELAPYAAGAQEFRFPYSALDSYWSDSGRAVLGLG